MSDRDIYILRHGETEWNRHGRMQGALDSALTDTGRAQANTQRQILERCDLNCFSFITSPLGRTRQTAARAMPDCDWIEDGRLAEIDVGTWTGWTREDMANDAPHLFDDPVGLTWYDHAPGGEGILSLERRLTTFLQNAPDRMVIVTHGITSRVLRCLLLGLPGDAFGTLTGGQGLVYRIHGKKYQKLTLQDTIDLR